MTRKGKVSSSSTFHIKLFGSVVVVLCRCRGRHHLRSNKGQRAESMRGAKKAKYSLLRPRDFVCSAEEKRREKGHSTRKPTTTNALWHVTCATRDLFHTTYYASESCNSSYETTDILSKTNDFNPHVCVCVGGQQLYYYVVVHYFATAATGPPLMRGWSSFCSRLLTMLSHVVDHSMTALFWGALLLLRVAEIILTSRHVNDKQNGNQVCLWPENNK